MRSLINKNKKGAGFLLGIGYAIVALTILVGIGLVVLTKLGDANAQCLGDKTWNVTGQVCSNATASAAGDGTAFDAIQYGMTQIGSSGLLGWLPAVIALMIGMFFLAYFMGRKSGGY